ncbi:uncharacterized protein LOC106672714 [Cimex lectularius]|uniref:Uncharacterized protein n=1 Tax=Cimex lectularius TaxID=79782 RepID=A0A8I6SAG7_CIMLE|nr:uncharacterized protein LOC106672714 [Cimex lectularius]
MKSLSLYVLLLPAFYSAYAITCFISKWWYRAKSKRASLKPTKLFETLFENHISEVFTNQSLATLTKIKEQTIKSLCKKPPEPLLLVFLAPSEAKSTAITLAKRLVQITLTSKNKMSLPWSATDRLLMKGSAFANITSPWRFYEVIKEKIATNSHLIITEFEMIHPHSAALLIFMSKELFFPEKEVHLYLIVEIPSIHLSNTVNALNHWMKTRLVSHLEPELLQETQRALYLRTCLIKSEDVSVVE